jgi:hypothetical protein
MMCQYLDPASFMVNVFAVFPERKTLPLPLLRDVRDHVAKSLSSQNVVIEWTRDAVMGALESYPSVFAYCGQDVVWQDAADRDAVKKHFDVGFSDAFVETLRQAIQASPMRRVNALV